MFNHQYFVSAVGNVFSHIFVSFVAKYHGTDFGIQFGCQIIGFGQELKGYAILEIIAIICKDPDGGVQSFHILNIHIYNGSASPLVVEAANLIGEETSSKPE